MNTDNSPVLRARTNEVVRLVNLIAHKHLLVEAELVCVKWHAYRYFSPIALNTMFRDAYNERCKARLPRNLETAPRNSGGIGSKLSIWKPTSHYTQLHIARQHADQSGMPYDEYIRFCFDFADRRTRGHLPRPNQLRPSEKAHDAWFSMMSEVWTPEAFWLLLVSKAVSPLFKQDHYSGLPAQLAFREELNWLSQQTTTNKAAFYGHVVLKNQWLGKEDLNNATSEVWLRAQAAAEDDQDRGEYTILQELPVAVKDSFQSCYGVPGIDTEKVATCKSCPVRAECNRFRSEVCDILYAKTGSDDPIRKQQRERSRERVEKCRAKQVSRKLLDRKHAYTPEV